MHLRHALFISFLLLIFCNISLAQSERTQNNFRIEMQPLFISLGVVDAKLSTKVLPHLDLLVSIDGGYLWLPKLLSKEEDFWGLGGGIGARLHARGQLEDGFYAQADIKFMHVKFGNDMGGLLLAPLLGAGYGWYFISGLFVLTGIDMHLPIAPSGFGKEKAMLPTKYPIPLLNCTIGYTL